MTPDEDEDDGEGEGGAGQRNDLSGTVNGLSIQAHVISGPVFIGDQNVHEHVLALREDVADVKRKLAESMGADRAITQVVWILQDGLVTLRDEVRRLTWELGRQRGESERLRTELAAAKDAAVKTEERLARAEEERERAQELVRLAELRLQSMLDSPAASTPSVVTPEKPANVPAVIIPALELDGFQAHMERIDDYLDAQEVRLGGLLNDLRQAHRSSSEQPTTTGPVEPPLFPSRHGGAKRPPRSGWRKTLLSWSGGLVNLGEGPADVRRRKLINLIDRPLHACYKIAVLSLKGGVGKTTTTVNLGSTFASLRGDRVIAVDADPDRGTLALKVPRETTATVRHLLRDAAKITRYNDVRAYTSQSPSRLEVLASEQDPAVSEAFDDQDYLHTMGLLELFYNIVLTDCGTGLMRSAMKGVLDQADSLVLVSSGSVDGAQTSAATLDWLDAHGYRDLVAKSVAVINSVRPGSGKVDLDKLAAHFTRRCRAVVRIPFDTHLEEGAEIELDKLAPETRLALLELAATVADDFPNKATTTD